MTKSTSDLIPSPRYSGERLRVRGLHLLPIPVSRSQHQPPHTATIPTTRNDELIRGESSSSRPASPRKKDGPGRVPLAVPGIRPPQNGNHLSRHESPGTSDHFAGAIDNKAGKVPPISMLMLPEHVIFVAGILARVYVLSWPVVAPLTRCRSKAIFCCSFTSMSSYG